MKFGIRTPSLRKRWAARTSFKRYVRHSLGFKAPRGYGWITNPRRAAYNRVYNRTTVRADNLIVPLVILIFAGIAWVVKALIGLIRQQRSVSSAAAVPSKACPRCNASMVLRTGPHGPFYGCSRFPACRSTRNL